MTIRDIDDLIEDCRRRRGLTLNGLPPGTRLRVETRNSLYEFTLNGGRKATVFGGTLPDGGVRFPRPADALIVGSSWGGSAVRLDR